MQKFFIINYRMPGLFSDLLRNGNVLGILHSNFVTVYFRLQSAKDSYISIVVIVYLYFWMKVLLNSSTIFWIMLCKLFFCILKKVVSTVLIHMNTGIWFVHISVMFPYVLKKSPPLKMALESFLKHFSKLFNTFFQNILTWNKFSFVH
jgi:hypothetical protein